MSSIRPESFDGRVSFLVDTNSYSGNFERQLVAWMTAKAGDDDHGSEIVEEVYRTFPPDILVWFDEYTLVASDDRGYERYADIAPTPGWYNDGKGGHFKEGEGPGGEYPAYQSVEVAFDAIPPANVIEFMIERAKVFAATPKGNMARYITPFEILGFRLIEYKVSSETLWTWDSPIAKIDEIG